jgi:hypothetical protein
VAGDGLGWRVDSGVAVFREVRQSSKGRRVLRSRGFVGESSGRRWY